MGKKKGKGKSQAQGASGDAGPSTQQEPQPSQPPEQPQPKQDQPTQQQQSRRQKKERKGQDRKEVHTGPEGDAAQQHYQSQGEPRQGPSQPPQQMQSGTPVQQQVPPPGFRQAQTARPQQEHQQQPMQRGPQQQQMGQPQQHQQMGPPQQQQQLGPPQQQQQLGAAQLQQQTELLQQLLQMGLSQQQQQGGPPQQQQMGTPPQYWGQPMPGTPGQPFSGPPPQQSAWGPQQQMQGPPSQYMQGPPSQQRQGPQQQQRQGPQQQQRQGQQRQGHPHQRQTQGLPPPHQMQGPPSQRMQSPPPQGPQGRPGPQQRQTQGPPQTQQMQGPPSQQMQGPPSQQMQGPPPQQMQGSPSQGPQGRPGPQPRRDPQQQRPPQSQHQQQSVPPQVPQPSQSKEASPPLGGGDRLKQLALVNPGTKGRKIPIESNHLALDVGKLKQAVHYDVDIDPNTPKALLRDVINRFGEKHYPKRFPAFDGRKNLYSPNMLPFGEAIEDVIKVDGENNRPKEFKVKIKFARYVDLSPLHDMLRTKTSPQDALQCLDIVLRNAPSNTCITAGRCFFTPPAGQIIPLGDGMEMYYGFYQSAIRGWKPLLNVDVAHKAFPSAIQVLELICQLGTDFRNTMTFNDLARPINEYLRTGLEKFLKTLKVKYEITGQSSTKRIYRVNGLGAPPSAAQFQLDNGQKTTVEKYFQDVKRVRLRYPHLPTLWVGARERESKILLPLEFCSVVEGQAINRKMNENQTSAMIKKSATSTEIRKQKIMATLQQARFNNDSCIREFGFSVNQQFERLEARVLPPPSLMYAGDNIVTPQKGVWRNDRSKFLTGAVISKWTVAYVTRQIPRGGMGEQLADNIYKFATSCGMEMRAKALLPFVLIGGRQSLQDIIEYFRKKRDFDLIFVVVPNAGPQYSLVKQAAELNVGCLTQCIKERTLMKLNPQTVVNILLKVNSKLNGVNHAFSGRSRPPIMNRPCMIMGADVTHPSPDAKDIPSVAAVTASHDAKAFQYNICWRLQPPKTEIIEDLCNITVEQLKFFHKKTNCKPERIIFFRDGVSEGQFQEVQRAEIRAIQKACKMLQADNYEPSITFLVVQKRHHTRLFPTNPRDSEDRNMNVPAGTCVDTVITNPTMQDFYLVSHASIQGVAKPTKYCTLWDDNNMSNDDIEELTYHLCHMFTRCNRSVSYPAPTYYAHLAAARAKVYIENAKLNMDALKKHQESYQIQECIVKDKPMFFV